MIAEIATTNGKKPTMIRLRGIDDIEARTKQIHALVARRAYAFYEGRGHTDGHDSGDWLQAESEVRAPFWAGLMELNGAVRVDLGITASELPQLRVKIEPKRVVVSGKRDPRSEHMTGNLQGGRPNAVEIFQTIELPVEVEPSAATSTFSNGLVEITIPKAARAGKAVVAQAA